jgi:hypothetical protein
VFDVVSVGIRDVRLDGNMNFENRVEKRIVMRNQVKFLKKKYHVFHLKALAGMESWLIVLFIKPAQSIETF